MRRTRDAGRWPTGRARTRTCSPAADQDTATASSIAAALLSYHTIAQVDGLLAGKLGVTEAASALQLAVRFPDDGGADEVVAPKERRFAPQRLQRGPGHAHRGRSERGRLHPDPGGEPVKHRAHLQLNPGPRALFACRYRLARPPTCGAQTPCAAASWATRAPGALPRCTSQCLRTGWRSLPNQRQERWTSAASRSWTQPWRPAVEGC